MVKAAHRLSEVIALQLNMDEDKKAVIEYGLIAFFNLIVIGAVISAVGLIFGFWYESVVVFLGVGLLKKSTGGAHSDSMLGCVVISVVSISLFAFLSRYILNVPITIYLNIGLSLAVFLLSFLIFHKNVPVDSPNKPITKPDKIKRLRKQSFILLACFTALTLALSFLSTNHIRFFSIVFSIRFVLLWQTFMITKVGARFMKALDKFAKKEV